MSIMRINYPTLAHFRHFSSLLTNFPSTTVENSLQITPFYAKQTQSQVRQNQRKFFCDKYIRTSVTFGYSENKPNSNPIQTQFKPISKPNKPNSNPTCSELVEPFQTQSKACPERSRMGQFQTGHIFLNRVK